MFGQAISLAPHRRHLKLLGVLTKQPEGCSASEEIIARVLDVILRVGKFPQHNQNKIELSARVT